MLKKKRDLPDPPEEGQLPRNPVNVSEVCGYLHIVSANS